MWIVLYYLMDNKGKILFKQINCKIIKLRSWEKSSKVLKILYNLILDYTFK